MSGDYPKLVLQTIHGWPATQTYPYQVVGHTTCRFCGAYAQTSDNYCRACGRMIRHCCRTCGQPFPLEWRAP